MEKIQLEFSLEDLIGFNLLIDDDCGGILQSGHPYSENS